MKFSKLIALLIFLIPVLTFSPVAYADWVWSPEQGKFVNTDEGGQDSAQDAFDQALDLFQEKKLDDAAKQFEVILKKHPKSRVAPESQYRLGTIYEESGDLLKAHKAYQNLLKTYPQSERFEEVVEREYGLGMAFLSGEKGKVFGIKIKPSLSTSIEIFKGLVEAAPFSAYGDKAQYQLGIAHLKAGQYDQAVEALQEVVDQYPQSPLVQDARLQMTEAAYAKSQVETRDQSALDEASAQADWYLKKYGTSAEADKAAKIRREVDERNAEKNYRIGAYYEKENYLESALIYYRDTAKRYSETLWGQKAADKMRSLEQPVTYLTAKEDDVRAQISKLEAELNALGKGDKQERDRLEAEIKKQKKKLRAIDKSKVDTLSRRKQDLKRRETELKEKFKEFERKKKRYRDNTSPDFQKALDRWRTSLEAERDAIEEEKARLANWREELGVPSEPFYQNMLAFMQPETPIEKVRSFGEKDLYKLAKKKKDLFEEKEKLYKRYTVLQADLAPALTETGVEIKRLRGTERKQIAEKPAGQRTPREEEIRKLDRQLDEKLVLYEKHFGKLAEQELEAILAKQAGGAQAGQPVHFNVEGDASQKSLDELLALRMHLGEKLAVEQTVMDTLSHAFNVELVRQEQNEMMQSLNAREEINIRDLRKQIKDNEREIRKRYQDIQDRHKRKNQLLDELDGVIHGDRRSPRNAVTRVVTAPVYLTRSFLFGLPNKDEEVNKEGKKSVEAAAQDLQQQIELESLMIEAQNLEISRLEKEHEILTAKASLAGGYKFRGAFVKVPYVFIDEAVQSAKRIVPKKQRKDVLLNRMDKESHKLEGTKKRLADVEAAIAAKSAPSASVVPVAESVSADAKPAGTAPVAASAPDEKALREEITGLFERLEIQYSMYAEEQGLLSEEYRNKLDVEMKASGADKEKVRRYKEFRELEASLAGVIKKEIEITSEESGILQKRLAEIERLLPEVKSKAMTQDMLTEKTRTEQRLTDLDVRRDFLTKEMTRYERKSL